MAEGTPIARVLTVDETTLPVSDAAKVRRVVDDIFSACDADDDGAIDRGEAKGCRQHLYDLLASIPPPPSAAPASAAPAAPAAPAPAGASKPRAATPGGGAAGGGTPFAARFSQLRGQGQGRGAGGAGGAAKRGRSGPADPLAMVPAPLRRKLQRIQRQVQQNLAQPNFNTYLAGLGAGALALRQARRDHRDEKAPTRLHASRADCIASAQAVCLDVGGSQKAFKAMVGPLPEFLAKLRNVALVATLAAAFGRFDG